MKKARFMIPEHMNLTKDQYDEIAPMWDKEGEICELRQVGVGYWYFEDGSNFSDGAWVRETWLEEIKEEPKVMSASEWFIKKHCKDDPAAPFYDQFEQSDLVEAYDAGEENERKKHEPKNSFDYFILESCPGVTQGMVEYRLLRRGWEAAEKNRGYDEDN